MCLVFIPQATTRVLLREFTRAMFLGVTVNSYPLCLIKVILNAVFLEAQ